MEKYIYKKVYELEKDNWWFKGKRKIIFTFLDGYYKNKKNLKILDVGCGSGILLENLEKYGETYGIDSSKEAINLCKKRGLKNIKLTSAGKLPFKNNYFDLITAIDLLYHKKIKNDLKVIKEMKRILKPKGRLVITDSAMMCLWSPHDKVVHARTRYSKKGMQLKLKKAGMKIEKLSYFNTFLFPIIFTVRKFNSLMNIKQKMDIKKMNKLANTLLYLILKTESYLLKNMNFPWGVSILVIARK